MNPHSPHRFPPLWQKLLNHRWVLFNLLFALYLLLLQPLLLRRLNGVITRHRTDLPLAFLLLGVQLLELVGMIWKAPLLRHQLHQRDEAANTQVWSFLIWIAHITLNVILLMTAMQALGIPIAQAESDSTAQTALMIGYTLVILKELGILFWWLSLEGAPPDGEFPPPSHTLLPALGDLLLLVFSAVTFTSLWDWMAASTPLNTANLALALVEYASAALMFLIAFAAARGHLLVEQILFLRSQRQSLLQAASILLNLVIALALLTRSA